MINAVVVGLGRMGRNLVNSVQGKSEHIRFTHAVVRHPDTAKDFATKHGLELLTDFSHALKSDKVQAVVLTTPHQLHAEQVIAAAGAGKPVFCEKPLALTRVDAERAIDACKRAGVPLGVGYNKRFWPSMCELKRVVASGELGEILHVETHFSNESTGKFYGGWLAEIPGGGLIATGTHVLDGLISVVGPVRRVQGQRMIHDPSPAPVDTIAVLMEFANRVSGVLCCVRTTAQYWRVHVFGKNGSAEALEDVDLVIRKNETPPRRLTFERVDALRCELEEFAKAIATGKPYPISFEDMIDAVAATEAIIKSLETGNSTAVSMR